jgi:sugar lactone lactonase YvrE
MNTTTPVTIVGAAALLGEGPVWDPVGRALWFVDIKQLRLHRFTPASGRFESWTAPAQPGWIFPVDEQSLIVGLQTGIHRFVPGDNSFTFLADPEPDLPGNRLNDATVAPNGAIWFGTMDDAATAPTGRLYSFDGAVTSQPVDPVAISNGPAFSPDGGTLYYVDTLGCVIWAIEVIHGRLGEKRLFVRIEPGTGLPDGPTVDAQGCVWVGLFGGWCVRRYSPGGALLEEVRFPVANITKIAFGGDDLRTVYATTASVGLDAAALAAQPEAGNLFAFHSTVPGLPSPRPILASNR